jgi:hypothetical protein
LPTRKVVVTLTFARERQVFTQKIGQRSARAQCRLPAERMLLDGEPAVPADDLRQARELANLICASDEAVETFIAHCDVVARDLLMPYGDVVIVLSTVLRIKRMLDGAEIDKIIWDVEAPKALAMERQRRADWRKRELAASRFRAECDHLDRGCHILPQIRCGNQRHV